MSAIVVVDSLEAVEAARAIADAAIVTDNPMLAALAPVPVVNCDALISQAEALALGRAALALTDAIERALNTPDIARLFGLAEGNVRLIGPASRLVASLFHRGAALARALAAHGADRIHLRLLDLPRWEAGQPLILPRFAHPARALAEAGFFAPLPVEWQAVATALPKNVNDTSIRDYGRRMAMLPVPVIAMEMASRLRKDSTAAPVVIGQENEAVRETLPWLALRGIRFRRFGKLGVAEPVPARGFDEPVVVEPLVERAVLGLLRDGARATGMFSPTQADALAGLISQHLSAGLAWLSGQMPGLRRRLDRAFPGGKGTLLTNGLFGTLGPQVYGLCRQRGIKVFEFEHGLTAGIAALTDEKLAGELTQGADAIMVCSDRSARSFAASGAQTVRVIGLADQVREMLRPRLQRRLARRALGLGSEPVVMHVSTLPYFGNHRPGLGAPTETTTYTLDRTLLTEVYPRIGHRVVFKQYPTQRFPFEPAYQSAFPAAANVTVTKDEDFRYIRAAADVIVTMTPTSTLGWCIGTGAPVVWLDSKLINPLTDEDVREGFRRAFLFIDLDEADWAEKLRACLARPLERIRADWDARAADRKALYGAVLAGPNGATGRRAAAVVAALLKA